MDFGILPPEVNSGRMYAGPGAGPMLAAAAAWDGLAAGLESTAHSYESVLLELAKGWTGPSATAMASAASPYASWMHHTAAQAEHAANQARFAAATYESAFTMTVPPPVIAANRSQLLALIATNFFGQNTPAIAATEAHYAEMWAQDAAAMYGYADGSSTASMLAPFPQPPQTANPGGLGHQATAAANTGANTSATNGQSALSQLMSALPGLVSPMANGGASSSGISTALHAAIIAGDVGFDLLGAFIVDGIGAFAIDPAGVAIGYATHDINPARNGGKRPYLLAGSSAGVGKATSIGGLSVPPSWTAAGPELRPTASAKPANNTNSSDTSADPSANPLNTMAMTGLAGLAGTAGLGRGQKPPQTAGQQRLKPQQKAANVPEPEIATELRELIDLNYAGILTDKEYAEQKERLFNQ